MAVLDKTRRAIVRLPGETSKEAIERAILSKGPIAEKIIFHLGEGINNGKKQFILKHLHVDEETLREAIAELKLDRSRVSKLALKRGYWVPKTETAKDLLISILANNRQPFRNMALLERGLNNGHRHWIEKRLGLPAEVILECISLARTKVEQRVWAG